MPRGKSDTINKIEVEFNTLDCVYYIARNNGAPIPAKGLEKILTENQQEAIKAAKDAIMGVLQGALNKVAGIQELPPLPAIEDENLAPTTSAPAKAKGSTK